eukprot:g13590.t1
MVKGIKFDQVYRSDDAGGACKGKLRKNRQTFPPTFLESDLQQHPDVVEKSPSPEQAADAAHPETPGPSPHAAEAAATDKKDTSKAKDTSGGGKRLSEAAKKRLKESEPAAELKSALQDQAKGPDPTDQLLCNCIRIRTCLLVAAGVTILLLVLVCVVAGEGGAGFLEGEGIEARPLPEPVQGGGGNTFDSAALDSEYNVPQSLSSKSGPKITAEQAATDRSAHFGAGASVLRTGTESVTSFMPASTPASQKKGTRFLGSQKGPKAGESMFSFGDKRK